MYNHPGSYDFLVVSVFILSSMAAVDTSSLGYIDSEGFLIILFDVYIDHHLQDVFRIYIIYIMQDS